MAWWTPASSSLRRVGARHLGPAGRDRVSVVTYGELRAGVLAATDVSVRSRRLSTLQTVAELAPLTVDTAVADEWARLRLLLAASGRRVNVNDTWIAATALAHDVPVVTQDADYGALAEVSDL